MSVSAISSSSTLNEKIDTFFWTSNDILRSAISPFGHKRIIFTVFFLKYISDLRKDNDTNNGGNRYHTFIIPPGCSFDEILKNFDPVHFGENVNRALHAIEEANSAQLSGVLTTTDFNGASKSIEDFNFAVEYLFKLIDTYFDFRPSLTDIKYAGDIFSALIDKFARQEGFRGGEGYTPQNLLPLLVKLLQPVGGKSLYDPTVGTGGMLIQADQFAKEQTPNSRPLRLFGQDNNLDSISTSIMNLLLHQVFDAKIYWGDTLSDPKTNMEGKLQQFDYVLSSPPFSVQLNEHAIDELQSNSFNRFPFGVPSRTADYLFLQHALSSLNETGKALLIISGRMLFVTGQEGEIRKSFIENDLIEAVIGLSPGLLTNTSIPIYLVIINKSKSDDRKGKILLINASEQYERAGRRERFLTPEQQNRILDAYKNFRDTKSFSAVINISEAQRNEYNLMPSRYIDLFAINDFLGGKVIWEKFEKIADIQRSTIKISHANGNEAVPVIRISDLSNFQIGSDDLEKYNYQQGNDQPLYAQVGDILFTHVGGNKAVVVNDAISGVLVGNSIFVIRLKPEYSDLKQYIVEFLRSDKGHNLLSRYYVGAAAPVLRLSDLRNVKLPIPEESVTQLLSSIHQVEMNLLQRIEKARELRTKLFNINDADVVQKQLEELGTETKILSSSLIQAESLDYQIRNFYPYPLAFPYRNLSAIYDPVLKYPQQLRVAENLLVFLATIGLTIAQLNNGLKGQSEITRTSIKDYFEGGISPGDWQLLAYSSAKVIRGQRQYAIGDSFAALWFKGSGNRVTEFTNYTKALVKIKNDYKHDRGPKTPQDYATASEEIQKILDFCYAQLAFLIKYPIRLVQSMDVEYLTNLAILETLVYEGDHPGLRREQVRHPTALTKDILYLEINKETWAPLFPHINVQYCQFCKTPETYFIDLWEGSDGKILLKSFEQGHTHNHTTDMRQVVTYFEYWTRNNFDN